MDYSYDTIARIEAAMLWPEEDEEGRYECSVCGLRSAHAKHYGIRGSVIFEFCMDGFLLPYDIYPEEEEEAHVCCTCGFPCEDEVTIIDGDAFCKDCVEDAKL